MKHYEECAQAFAVFEQFRPFISRSAERELKTVLQKKGNMTNEEFRAYFEVLKKFLELVNAVPDNVYFPLFDINCF